MKRQGWYGNREMHSLASKGIKTTDDYEYEWDENVEEDMKREQEAILSYEQELKNNPELLEKLVFESVVCENYSSEEINDADNYESVCTLKISKVISVRTGNISEFIVEGTIAGVHDIYWLEDSYYPATYNDPPDGEFNWSTLDERIKYVREKLERDKKTISNPQYRGYTSRFKVSRDEEYLKYLEEKNRK